MSAALNHYRALRATLGELRAAIIASGFPPLEEGSPAEDEILERMDIAWWQLTVEERALLDREGVR
jgi:hypothetical protein